MQVFLFFLFLRGLVRQGGVDPFELNRHPTWLKRRPRGIPRLVSDFDDQAVATTNMSIAAMSGRWLRRKLRQAGEGPWAATAGNLPTVAWLTSIPSLSNAPWMRGAPRAGWPGLYQASQILTLGAIATSFDDSLS
jgi:hypothetical protein